MARAEAGARPRGGGECSTKSKRSGPGLMNGPALARTVWRPPRPTGDEASLAASSVRASLRMVERPPTGAGWLHEVKHDGFRIVALKKRDRIQLWSRRGVASPIGSKKAQCNREAAKICRATDI